MIGMLHPETQRKTVLMFVVPPIHSYIDKDTTFHGFVFLCEGSGVQSFIQLIPDNQKKTTVA